MKWFKKLKEKFNHQSEMVKLMSYAGDNLENMIVALANALTAFCLNKDEEVEENALETLKIEIKIHNLYHSLIEEMYTRKTMNFSREDRYYIISQIIEISDLSDFIARRLRVHRPVIGKMLSDILLNGLEDLKKLGGMLNDLILGLLENFKEIEKLVWDIHHLQRAMWKYEVNFIDNIYKQDVSPEDIVYYEILIRNLRRLVMISVRFADGARRLIYKYTL